MLLIVSMVVTLTIALLCLFFAFICTVDNYDSGAKFFIRSCAIFAVLLIVEVIVDTKYYKPERIIKTQQELKEKYKNGPIKITTNSIGCIKYRYYNDLFWTCPNKNIKQIEEQEGKMTVLTPVVNKI